MNKARQAVAQTLSAEKARRDHRRSLASSFWGQGDPETRQRTAMIIAAFLLDEAREEELADWLLCAKPAHAKEIATGVAVHALRRCCPAAWDALAAIDAVDIRQADEWLDDNSDFVWEPKPEWLVSSPLLKAAGHG